MSCNRLRFTPLIRDDGVEKTDEYRTVILTQVRCVISMNYKGGIR